MNSDREHLGRLLILAEELERDFSRLSYTIGEMEAVFNSLSASRDVWRSKLVHHWGALDDVRAMMAFDPDRIDASEQERVILTATGQLKRRLRESIETLGSGGAEPST